MQIRQFVLWLAIPAALSASPAGLPLGPSPTTVSVGANGAVTIPICTEPGFCTISGSGTASGVTLNWGLTVNTADPITLDGTPPGNTSLGTIVMDPATIQINDGGLGDLIRAQTLSNEAPAWTSSPSQTTLTLTADITSETLGATGSALLNNYLGSVPAVGSDVTLTFDLVCSPSQQCVQSGDPTGTIIGGAVTLASSAVPEPSNAALVGGGLALLLWARRRLRLR